MKILLFPAPTRRQRGSVLLTCVLVTFLVGLGLMSYLTLVENQNLSVARSQAWNYNIAVAEAGVEEALAHLNSPNTWDNLASNGWQPLPTGNGVRAPRRYLAGGAFYDVMITNVAANGIHPGDNPIIVSVAHAPARSTFGGLTAMLLATVGVTPPETPALVTRGVQVRTRVRGFFNMAMLAKETIDLNGNNIMTDSFDSTDPRYSTAGLYDPAPAKTKDNGDVATNSRIINSLNVGNANIKGRVSTGPGGSVAIGPSGTVGTKAWVEGGNLGIQPGRRFDDMNVVIPDVQLPQVGWFAAPRFNGVTIGGVSYNYVLTDGNWWISRTLSDKVYVAGRVNLLVTGGVNMTGNDVIRIAPGARLNMYVTSSSAKIAGNGVINESGFATNFVYYGLPNNTSVAIAGNGTFTGCIYAPQAALSLSGGGTEETDLVGATVSRTVQMNGHFKFHYDESLSRFGPGAGYVPIEWREL